MSLVQKINCPECHKSDIEINITLLCNGTIFKCPNTECNATISLFSQDRTLLSEAAKKLESIRH